MLYYVVRTGLLGLNSNANFEHSTKEGGKMRHLGIPTVVDRMVQQAIDQVLTIIHEPQFSKRSFGFRPGRGCLNALREVQKIVDEVKKGCCARTKNSSGCRARVLDASSHVQEADSRTVHEILVLYVKTVTD